MLYKTCTLFALLLLSCCTNSTPKSDLTQTARLAKFEIAYVRLFDGVPLQLNLIMRWQINDQELFERFKMTPDSFQCVLMQARAQESLRQMAHEYQSVDSVFLGQRQMFVDHAKSVLKQSLGKDGIVVHDVSVTSLIFPQSYVSAMETAGLQRQELERIRQQTSIAIAESDGQRRRAEAQSRVQLAQEEANARIRDLQASTEQRRRNAEIARAETEVQLEAKRALIAADHKRQMDQVDLEKLDRENQLAIEKQREMDKAELTKMAQQNALDHSKAQQQNEVESERNTNLAKICQSNPDYAKFVVNKALAEKVSIAVLPNNLGQGVLGTFLEQQTPNKK